MDTVYLEVLTASRFQEARAFYTTTGYSAAIADNCSIFAARLDGNMIGVARLAPERGVLVLRGMMLAKSYQRKGIGGRMLRFMQPYMEGSDVYCLPHGWLDAFYDQIGFVKIDLAEATAHLRERLAEQRPSHPELIIMARKCAPR